MFGQIFTSSQENDAKSQEWHRCAQSESCHQRGGNCQTTSIRMYCLRRALLQAKSGSLLEYRAEGEGDLKVSPERF